MRYILMRWGNGPKDVGVAARGIGDPEEVYKPDIPIAAGERSAGAKKKGTLTHP